MVVVVVVPRGSPPFLPPTLRERALSAAVWKFCLWLRGAGDYGLSAGAFMGRFSVRFLVCFQYLLVLSCRLCVFCVCDSCGGSGCGDSAVSYFLFGTLTWWQAVAVVVDSLLLLVLVYWCSLCVCGVVVAVVVRVCGCFSCCIDLGGWL